VVPRKLSIHWLSKRFKRNEGPKRISTQHSRKRRSKHFRRNEGPKRKRAQHYESEAQNVSEKTKALKE
jgi:hypothetical protein